MILRLADGVSRPAVCCQSHITIIGAVAMHHVEREEICPCITSAKK